MDTAKGILLSTILKGDMDTILSRIPINNDTLWLVFPLSTHDTTGLALIGHCRTAAWLKEKLGEYSGNTGMVFLLGLGSPTQSPLEPYFGNSDFRMVRLTAEKGELIGKLLRKLYRGQEREANKPIQKLYYSMLLQILGEVLSADRIFRNRAQALTQDFLTLLHSQKAPEHHVQFYADTLFVSRRYFTKAVHGVLGVAPKSIIDKRLTDLSKKLLSINTTIYCIAEALKFESPAAFAAFFRKHVGCTPSQYRTTLLNPRQDDTALSP